VNPLLEKLQPYPFEKLRRLLHGVTGNEKLKPINLQIGEPKHPTPELEWRQLPEETRGTVTRLMARLLVDHGRSDRRPSLAGRRRDV